MMSRILLYDEAARKALKRGIDALADMVKVTLGPRGNNVVIERKYGGPLVTKDGVTVAKEIFLKDPVENMGAQLLKEVASKTADIAGDGTTTATVLAQAIIKDGIKYVVAGANPMDLKRGIDKAVKLVVGELNVMKKEVSSKEEIVQIGTISANNEREIGELLADAMEEAGKEGVITVEEAKGTETVKEVVEGMQFDRGYMSPYFITNINAMDCTLTDALVFLYDKKLQNIQDILAILETTAQGGNALLMVVEDISDQALQALIVNKLKGVLRVCVVKAPGFGDRRKDILQDLAILTGGKVISEEIGMKLSQATIDDLGYVEKVVVVKDKTTIIGGRGSEEDVEQRASQIKTLIEQSESDYDKEKLQERLAKLTGGVVVLRVGAHTEAEMKEKKARVEDALHATRAAVDEGIVPGGGVAYVEASKVLEPTEHFNLQFDNDDQRIGASIVKNAICEPLRAIATNSGKNGEVVLSRVNDDPESERVDYGYNALTDTYGFLYDQGVIDPLKVVRVALENAASIAGLFLTTRGVIAESLEEKAEMEKLMNQEPKY